MKIAIVAGQFPALSETFILNHVTGLIDRGHEVDVYAGKPPEGDKTHPDVESYHLLDRTYYGRPVPTSNAARRLEVARLLAHALVRSRGSAVRVKRLLRDGRQDANTALRFSHLRRGDRAYDIIHCHFGPHGQWGMALRNMGVIGGKLLTAFHGYDVSRYLREAGPEVYDRLFEEGDLMLPISHYWKDKLIELGCDPRKIGVHRMGVDTGRFAFTPRTLPAEGPLRLVTVARLIDKKGVEYAIRAVAAYAEQGGEVEYTIIGDGPLAPALSRMVRELGMESHIRLTGAMERPGVFATLNRSHVLLAPSVTSADGNQEGIPVAIMEGMATGIPVISTYHTGIPELVEDGVTGMLVPERDPAAIVASLTRLADDPEMYVRVAAAGRERVEQEFDIHRLNDRLVDVYRAVLAGVPPAIQGGGTETRAETRTAAGVRHRDPGHGTPRQEASAPAAP